MGDVSWHSSLLHFRSSAGLLSALTSRSTWAQPCESSVMFSSFGPRLGQLTSFVRRPMKSLQVQLGDGTTATLFQADSGRWCCPVCGSPELTEQPYFSDASPSFEMCVCGFEFGFDDDPAASRETLPSVQANWEAWRNKVLRYLPAHELAAIQVRLANIGVVVK